MTTFDAGTIAGRRASADQPLVYRETVHGPVIGYATVDGSGVAISTKRSTRGASSRRCRFFLELSTHASARRGTSSARARRSS